MILEYEGYRVEEAADGPQALARVADRLPDAVVLDVKMPEMDGLAVLEAFRERGYEMPVLVISGHADFATAVEATRRGAYDFFEKPLQRERILVSLRNAVESYRLQTENTVLRRRLERPVRACSGREADGTAGQYRREPGLIVRARAPDRPRCGGARGRRDLPRCGGRRRPRPLWGCAGRRLARRAPRAPAPGNRRDG